MRSPIRTIPVTVSVPLLLAVPLLLVAGLLIAIATIDARARTRTLVGSTMAEITQRVKERLEALLQVPPRMTELNLGLLEDGRLDPDDVRGWRQVIADEIHAFPMLSAITWGDERSRSTWVARYAGEDRIIWAVKDAAGEGDIEEFRLDDSGEVLGARFNTYGYDPRGRPWYRVPFDKGERTWSPPFVWVGGDPSIPPTIGLAFGAPFRSPSGAITGVIDAEISLDDLSDFLETVELPEGGVITVTDADGRLLANSIGAPTTRGTEVLVAAASDNAVIARLAADAGQEEGAADRVQIDGGRWWVERTSYRDPTGLALEIGLAVPEAAFLGPVERSRQRNILLVVGAVILTVFGGVVLALMMVRPLLRLEAHAEQVGAGDLDRELVLDHTPELRRLSRSINEMTAGLRDRLELRKSLELAMEVQQSLLPADAPTLKGLDVAGHSTYCDETGGDYYDFLEVTGLPDDAVGVAVGDVMGHGVAAAMLMATARGILRSHARSNDSIGDLLTHMNDLLAPDTAGRRFMTMLLMIVDGSSRTVRWASAGHGPPIVYDPSTDSFPEYEGGDLPLGLMSGVEYGEHVIEDLAPGTILLAATDGVWEAPNERDELFGYERLESTIRAARDGTAQEIADAIRAAVNQFAGSAAQTDDVTFVVAKVRASYGEAVRAEVHRHDRVEESAPADSTGDSADGEIGVDRSADTGELPPPASS